MHPGCQLAHGEGVQAFDFERVDAGGRVVHIDAVDHQWHAERRDQFVTRLQLQHGGPVAARIHLDEFEDVSGKSRAFKTYRSVEGRYGPQELTLPPIGTRL